MEYFDSNLIELIDGNPEQDLWLECQLKSQPDCVFFAKVYDRKSKYGIKGGRISKLDVYRSIERKFPIRGNGDCYQIACYDRAWSQKPSPFNRRDRQALKIIFRAFRNEIII